MDNVEYVLDLEKEAIKLSEGIKEIYEEIGSYRKAKLDFLDTNEGLLKLIERTDELVSNSHTVISKLNEIGIPHLHDILAKMEKINSEHTADLRSRITETKFDVEKKIEYHKLEMQQIVVENAQQINNRIAETIQHSKRNFIFILVGISITVINLVILLL
jgi:hypothetical protein